MDRHPARTAAATTLVLALGIRGIVAAPAGSCAQTLPLQLRVYDCQLAAALSGGLDRSASLRMLVSRIGELKGIVFVQVVQSTRKTAVAAGLLHRISSSGETRLLTVVIERATTYGDASVVTLAHELRHVLEVLEDPDVRTEAEVNRLYERIGYTRAEGVVETDAALAAALTVAAELRAARAQARRK